MALSEQPLQFSDTSTKPSWGPTIVYSHPEGGIVAVGPDRSCAGRLVADVEPGQNGQSYVARSPAFEFAGQGEQPAQSVASLASETLNALFDALRTDGNLDQALTGWTRSVEHEVRAADNLLDQFCAQFEERIHAAFRFSLRDGTSRAFTNLSEDQANEALAVS